MLITCQTIGRPPTSISGLGSTEECSCRRAPRPPQRITTMGFTSGAYSQTLPGVASAAMSVANPEIFKAYDIRGLYGADIDARLAEQIGRAFARVIGELEDKPTAE